MFDLNARVRAILTDGLSDAAGTVTAVIPPALTRRGVPIYVVTWDDETEPGMYDGSELVHMGWCESTAEMFAHIDARADIMAANGDTLAAAALRAEVRS